MPSFTLRWTEWDAENEDPLAGLNSSYTNGSYTTGGTDGYMLNGGDEILGQSSCYTKNSSRLVYDYFKATLPSFGYVDYLWTLANQCGLVPPDNGRCHLEPVFFWLASTSDELSVDCAHLH